MKRILTSLAALLLLSVVAMAQSPIYGPQALSPLTDGTNNVGYVVASTITNYTAKVDCGKFQQVTFQFTYAGDAAGGASDFYIVHYKTSVDGVTFSSASTPIILPPIGVTNRTIVTNINSFGAGFIRIGISNAAGTANITNQAIQYAIKMSAP